VFKPHSGLADGTGVSAASVPAAPGTVPPRRRWLVATLQSWSAVAVLGVLPIVLVVVLGLLVVTNGRYGSDFATFWDSGRSMLHGESPYPSLQSLPQHADRKTFGPFVYPPSAAVAMVPFALLPFAVANVLFFLLNLACVALALRVLRVRDWRCYGAAFLSEPVFTATGIGTVSPLLLLGVAAAWRYRERALLLGALVAGLVSLKLFLWPLWLWLVRTRRLAAACAAVVIAAVAITAGWALIGFAGLTQYPRLLDRLTELVGTKSYSLYALERAGGIPSSTAQVVVLLLAVLGLVAAGVAFADDRRLLMSALGVALLVTPILWPHYLVLLFVPIALASRRFSVLWLVPLIFSLNTPGWSYGSAARIAPALALSTLMLAVALGRAAVAQRQASPAGL
jgi:hypothetical protein